MVEAKLRPLQMSDLDNMMSWVNDPEVIGNFANFNHPFSREEEKNYLEQIIASETDKAFAIETESGEYLGNIGVYQIHWPSRKGRLAIIIGNKERQGKGYAQSAITKLLELAFEQYNLHKVWLVAWEENKKAQHVYEKTGFVKEGVLRDEYFHKGKYHNMVTMSVLEQDYYKNKR